MACTDHCTADVPSSGGPASASTKRKKLFAFALFATLLLADVVGIVSGVDSQTKSSDNVGASTSHALVKHSCASTLYPELCYSTISSALGASRKVSSMKAVAELSLNIAIGAVKHNYKNIKKLTTLENLTGREKIALHDCLQTADEALDELYKVVDDLREYPNKKPLSQHADDLKTLLSSAITNQVTCLDGFSHDEAEKRVRKLLEAGQIHVERLCSNALALIKNLTDTDIANQNELVTNESTNNQTLSQQADADDLKILLVSDITNQETFLDGPSHCKVEKRARKSLELEAGPIHVENLCNNASNTDIGSQKRPVTNMELREDVNDGNGIKWPDWMPDSDRWLLQSSSETPNVVVAADGSGDFRTVSEAVAAAPDRSRERYIIKIKAGVYRENVDVPSRKTNIMFWGDGKTTTIITASRNVVDGSTTFNSSTVAAVGERFLARDITFQNTAGPSKHQAVALRVGSDRSAFYSCGMLAYQDTLYVHSNRQFYVNCVIVGTIDFIFGNAAAVIQNCIINARRPNPRQENMVTAQGRTDPNQNTGIVIQKCRIGATADLEPVIKEFPTYLGRPWKEYARVVVMQTYMTNVIDLAGWHVWAGDFALATLFFAEYNNSGAGANTCCRVPWSVTINEKEAEAFTAERFIDGGSWLSSTGFPFSLGL